MFEVCFCKWMPVNMAIWTVGNTRVRMVVLAWNDIQFYFIVTNIKEFPTLLIIRPISVIMHQNLVFCSSSTYNSAQWVRKNKSRALIINKIMSDPITLELGVDSLNHIFSFIDPDFLIYVAKRTCSSWCKVVRYNKE